MLESMLSLAVSMRLMEWGESPPISLDDQVPCEWCPNPHPQEDLLLHLAAVRYQSECQVCSGKKYISRATRNSSLIAARGDDLQFGGKKGDAAKLFNLLSESLALMAYIPGGVSFGSLRFEVGGDSESPPQGDKPGREPVRKLKRVLHHYARKVKRCQ
jgi:hypothetical protein